MIVFALLSLAIIAWEVFGFTEGLGLSSSSPLWTRITYQCCHDGILHAVVNVYCLMMMANRWRLRLSELATAVAIAALIPSFLLSERCVVGLSGALFAVFGMRSVYAENFLKFNLQVALVIALGFLFENAASWLHLYAYVAGMVFGMINKPIEWKDMNR